MTRNKLYSLFFIAFFAGLIYIFYHNQTIKEDNFRACIIKSVTGYPCPSCGTTRAVLLLLKGKFIDSILLNPFGIPVAVIMTVFPFWILIDIIFKKDSFFRWYKKTEEIIRKPWIAVILISLVLLNWIWNIYKHL